MVTRSLYLLFLISWIPSDVLSAHASALDSVRAAMFTLTSRDASGNSHVLRFGVSPGATYGFDRELREFPMPPSPPAPIFDFRFLDLPKQPRNPATGSYADIRGWPSTASRDTFAVRYVPMNGAYPMKVTFDRGLVCCADSVTLIIDGEHRVLRPEVFADPISFEGPSDRFVFIVHWKSMELLQGGPGR
jgi:hypothetical protein